MLEEKDEHTEHCCLKHGCKYSDSECTVVSGQKRQSYECEICKENPPNNIYIVCYVKFTKDKKYLERVHFETWYSTLDLARVKSKLNFDDEAGFLDGILIQESKEGVICSKKLLQEFYYFNDIREFELISLPYQDWRCLKNKY